MGTGIATIPRQQPKQKKPFLEFWDKMVSNIKLKAGDFRQEMKHPGEDSRWIANWLGWTVGFCIIASIIVVFATSERYYTLFGGFDIQALQIFLSVFGLAYAVIIGLLIVEARKRFHELSTILRDELKVISDINDCVSYFDDEIGDNRHNKDLIRQLSLEYVQRLSGFDWDLIREEQRGRAYAVRYINSLTDDEFPTGYDRKTLKDYPHIDPFMTPLITRIISANKHLEIKDDSETCAKQKLVDKICDLTSLRTDRLEMAENGLKGYLKVFMIFMSFVVIIVTIFASQGERLPQLFMVYATTAVIVGLYMILDDIDHPFSGKWQIDKKMLDSLEKKLADTD